MSEEKRTNLQELRDYAAYHIFPGLATDYFATRSADPSKPELYDILPIPFKRMVDRHIEMLQEGYLDKLAKESVDSLNGTSKLDVSEEETEDSFKLVFGVREEKAMSEEEEWVATRWEKRSDLDTHTLGGVTIERHSSPFYEGERFSVRLDGSRRVLNIRGEWEFEPIPSNRDDEFYERCRFLSCEDAKNTLRKSVGAEE